MSYISLDRKNLINLLSTKTKKRNTFYGYIGSHTITIPSRANSLLLTQPFSFIYSIKKSAFPLASIRNSLRRDLKIITKQFNSELLAKRKVILLGITHSITKNDYEKILKDIREITS